MTYRLKMLLGITAAFISLMVTMWKANRIKENKPFCTKCGKDLVSRYKWYCPECDLKF